MTATTELTSVPRPVKHQAGMSLVEILVVMVLSVGVVATISQVLLSVKRTHLSQTQVATMQSNARHALQVLGENIRMAGYLGENQEFWKIVETTDLTQKLPATITAECFTTDTGASKYRWIFPSLYNDGGTAPNIHYGPMLYGQDDGVSYFGGCIDTADYYQAKTDLLSVHYVGPNAVQDSAGGNGLQKNTLYARVSLTGGRAFSCDTTDDCVPSDGVAGETNYPLRATAFFVSSCAAPGPDNTCGSDDDIPGLNKVWLRADGTIGKTTVAEGVVSMQVRYGLDTSGDGLPDKYVDGDALNLKNKTHWSKWSEIRAVRIWLLMRGSAKESGFTSARASYTLADQSVNTVAGYRYQLFNLTVTLRNR